MSKKCLKCELEKELSNFYKCKKVKDGYRNLCKDCFDLDANGNNCGSKICQKCNEEKYLFKFRGKIEKKSVWCTECIRTYREEYKEIKKIDRQIRDSNRDNSLRKEQKSAWHKRTYEFRKDKIKQKELMYRQNNPEKIKQKSKKYYENNKEKIKIRDKNYAINNSEKIKIRNKDWRNNNRDKYRESKRKYVKIKNEINQIFKFTNSVRNGIRRGLQNKKPSKNLRTLEILGCSFDEFKIYLESKFEPWMNWQNKGLYNGTFNYGWDIDHIIPLATAKTEEDVIRLNHYTNLQPLCSHINRNIKKNKIISNF